MTRNQDHPPRRPGQVHLLQTVTEQMAGGGAEEEAGDQPDPQGGVLVGGGMRGRSVEVLVTVEVAGGGIAMVAEEEG